jgi:hypothetical protein
MTAPKVEAALRAPAGVASPADVSMYRRLVDAECRVADELLRLLGFNPGDVRTEGGNINLPKVRAAIKHPGDYPPRDMSAVVLAAVTERFPRWREDIQERFVLGVADAVRAALSPEVSSHKQGDALQEARPGWRLVPVEPTFEMKLAASQSWKPARDGHYTARMEVGAEVWAAMLAATPPQAPHKDQEQQG